MTRRGGVTGLALIILVGALALRFAQLDRLVTPDEPLWITRSARFDLALADGRFEDTYQAVHPGVTVMWAGAAAYEVLDPAVPAMVPGPVELNRQGEVHTVLEPNGVDPLSVLVDLRRAAILLNVAILVAALWLLGQAVGPWPALVAGVLIAAEPMHLGTSRLLHLDAPVAGLLLLSAVALLRYLQVDDVRYLIAAAVASALAWLTRTSALYLLAWTGAILLLPLARSWRDDPSLLRSAFRGALRAGVIWGTVAALTTVALWPALWVAPIATIEQTIDGSLSLASEAHSKQIFFRGRVWLDDPGWSFYPVSFVWRTTPTVLLGLGLAIVAAFAPVRFRLDRRTRLAAGYLALFGLGYFILLGFGAKKIDRYILPVILVADVLAAIGWYWLASRLWSRTGAYPTALALRAAAVASVAVALTVQIGLAAGSAPYYFTYYNPLLGGLDGAKDTMMIGWGEGFDQAGSWLNVQPGAAELRVTAGPWPAALDYYFAGDIDQRDHSGIPGGQVIEWLTADIAVVSFTEVQRQLVDPAFWAALQTAPLARVIRLEGEEMIWIYDLRGRPLPEEVYRSSPVAFEWEPGLRLLAMSAANQDIRAGESVRVSVWVQRPAAPRGALALRLALVHPETGERYALEADIPSSAIAKGATLVEQRVKTPEIATPGVYQICIQAVYPNGGPLLTGVAPGRDQPATEICGGTVEVLPPSG